MEDTKYKLVEKAYGINFSKVNEGYCYSEEICYAENLNKAKTILLKRNDEKHLGILNPLVILIFLFQGVKNMTAMNIMVKNLL